MSSASLPTGFTDLEVWAQRFAWARFEDRYRQRLASSQHELEAFYAALAPRAEAIASLLDTFSEPLDDAHQRLLHLVLAFMDVAPAVELYHQPDVPLGFDATRATFIEWGADCGPDHP